MYTALRYAAFGAAALSLAACAQPQTTGAGAETAEVKAEREAQMAFSWREQVSTASRVQRIGADVSIANVEHCGEETKPVFGFHAAEQHDWKKPEERTVALAHGVIGDYPVVRSVAALGPAAGKLKTGDEILAINGRTLSAALAMRPLLEAAAKTAPMTLSIRRGEEIMGLQLDAVAACGFPLEIDWSPRQNAFTDGEKVVISRGLVDLAESDHEIAMVLGHEIGHIASGHLEARRANAVVGGGVGLIADIGLAVLGVNTGGAFMKAGANVGARAYSQDFEREADYVGAYFAARAGYDVAAGKEIWRRVGAQTPRNLAFAGTHPTSPERYVAISNAAEEIRAGGGTGKALVPQNWESELD